MLTNSRFLKKLALNAAGAFMLIVAVNSGSDQLLLMAAILFLIPPVSYWLGRILMAGLTCERLLPPSCTEGERVVVTLTISNIGWLPKFFLRATDRLPRWMRHAGDRAPLILHLWAGESSQITYYLEADKRGVYQIGPAQLFSTDPLGFYTYTQTLPGDAELLVYPTVIPIRRSLLSGASAEGWRDQENALTRGSGVDFHGVREYQPGDELRRIHWRTTARTGRLAVTEFTQGFASNVLLALDLNREAYAGTDDGREGALEYAVKIAASLCYDLLQHGNSVRLLTPARPQAADSSAAPAADHGAAAAIRSDRTGLWLRMVETLARAEADSPMTLPELLASESAETEAGTSLVYITPDGASPELAAALADYRTRGIRIYGFALEAESFRAAGKKAAKSAEAPVGVVPGMAGGIGSVQPVHRGDDLQQALEGLGHVRK